MLQKLWDDLRDDTFARFFDFAPRLIYAIVFTVIGIVVIRFIMRTLRRIMKKAKTELSLKRFIESLSVTILYAVLGYIIGRTLGIAATTFIAAFSAAAITIGLALQGSLANFAGGLLILIFKPFRIGDEVIIQDVEGEVIDINILYTVINDWRGQHYTIPNGKVADGVVTNNSAEEYRRVQIELHFAFEEDFDRLREIVTTAMKSNPMALQDRPFQLWINKFEDSYIKASARCWARGSEYWSVYWEQEEIIKKALEKHNIKMQIPKKAIEQPDLRREMARSEHIN